MQLDKLLVHQIQQLKLKLDIEKQNFDNFFQSYINPDLVFNSKDYLFIKNNLQQSEIRLNIIQSDINQLIKQL